VYGRPHLARIWSAVPSTDHPPSLPFIVTMVPLTRSANSMSCSDSDSRDRRVSELRRSSGECQPASTRERPGHLGSPGKHESRLRTPAPSTCERDRFLLTFDSDPTEHF